MGTPDRKLLYGISAAAIVAILIYAAGPRLLGLATGGLEVQAPDTVVQIIGGQPATEERSANVGALITISGGRAKTTCTGTVIAPTAVLTAAHCLWSLPSIFPVYFSLNHDLTDLGGPGLVTVPADSARVLEWTLHPSFHIGRLKNASQTGPLSGFGLTYDIAVVWLDEPLDVEPAKIGRAAAFDALRPERPVWIAGYGSTDGDEATVGVKMEAKTVIQDLTDNELQVGRRPPVPQKCRGDSGGPTFVILEDNDNAPLHLVGVTSRAFDPGEACDVAGIDVRIDRHLSWLLKELNGRDALPLDERAELEAFAATLPPEIGSEQTETGFGAAAGFSNDTIDDSGGCRATGPPNTLGFVCTLLLARRLQRPRRRAQQ